MNNEDTGSNGIDLFGYATSVLKEINHAAFSKLEHPEPYLMDDTIQAAATILDTGGRTKKNAIYARSRQEKLEGGEDFGSWEYYYKPDACQRTVDWILENDPMALMEHLAGCRNRGRGQVLRMDNIQDYANEKLFGKK
jgi:hypothetical protein|tara:strand:- start:11 stop:424 length:414 start_codon:yes stop_codon:yes gene_type:complete